jgi:ATP-dependent DNA helicase RecG
MKSATLNELDFDLQNAAQTSRVIKQALKQGLIRPADPARPRAGYVPFWA